MAEPPTIVAAAIVFKGTIYTVPTPGRHHNVFALIREMTGANDVSVGEDGQGFVTSDRRFANRKEAAIIAISAGQISKLKWPPLLYSEDLW
mgnify:CR=1 FL=1